MATRGRDLSISILSDAKAFDLSGPAQGLEKLADSAQDAGRDLEKLGDSDAREELKRLGLEAKDAQERLEKFQSEVRDGRDDLDALGDQSKRTADKVDDAFDAIAKSSKSNLRGKLDDDTDAAKKSMREVGDEARDTGREMAASFTGSSDDIMGALQELGANAGVAFGPIGGALSIALGSGLGLFFADWQKKKEKLTEDVESFTAALVEGAGQLSEEFLNQQITGLDPKKLEELGKAAEEAALPVRDVIRAYAGDPAALERVNATIATGAQALRDSGIAGSEADPGLAAYGAAVAKVSEELGITSQALDRSKSAYQLMKEAMSEPVVPKVEGAGAIAAANATSKKVQAALSQRITIPVNLQDITRDTQLAILQAQEYARRHPITVYTQPGKRPIRDVP